MKKQSESSKSLQKYFRKQTIKWSLIGLILTLGFAIICIISSSKIASEQQAYMVAKATARAFRPSIVNGNTRDAQFQILYVLDLKEGESALILNPKLQPNYPLGDNDTKTECQPVQKFCWSKDFKFVTVLYPIYFDDPAKDGIYGYLKVTLHSMIDWNYLYLIVLLALAAFIALFFGLSSALRHCATLVTNRLSLWAHHLNNNPTDSTQKMPQVPFYELAPMQNAVDGLRDQITKLQNEAAQEAKAIAQLAIIREIGHDLRTPLSQLSKYWTLHLDTIQSGKPLDDNEVSSVNRTLRRMGGIIRQIRAAHQVETHNDEPWIKNLADETKTVLDDLSLGLEIPHRNISLKFIPSDFIPELMITRTEYYQILENLIRNSLESIAHERGEITVSLSESNGSPLLSVQDNGAGIPEKAQDKIFDFDFTLKLGKGAGIGLGIVKRICKKRNAEISFKTEHGIGTEFIIKFKKFELPKGKVYEVQSINS